MSAAAEPVGADSVAADRRRVDDLISRLPETRDGDRGFDAPWEIRAFALAVAAHDAGKYPWSEFQGALIESIRVWEEKFSADDPSWAYYEHWVNALEAVLANSATLDPDALDQRTQHVLHSCPDRHDQVLHAEPVAIDPATTPAGG